MALGLVAASAGASAQHPSALLPEINSATLPPEPDSITGVMPDTSNHEVNSACPAMRQYSPRTVHQLIEPSNLVKDMTECNAFEDGLIMSTMWASNIIFHDRQRKRPSNDATCAEVFPEEASHRSWLKEVAAYGQKNNANHTADLDCYYQRVYGGAVQGGLVDVSGLDFFWSHAPTLGSAHINVSWLSTAHNGPESIGACAVPEGTLWAVWNDASMHPAILSCTGAARRCSCSNDACAPRLLVNPTSSKLDATAGQSSFSSGFQCAMDAVPRSKLRSPGFFVHREGVRSAGVADHTWVEVMRTARMDKFYGGEAPAESLEGFRSKMDLVGQLWFRVARGSGVWLNVGRSQRHSGRSNNPSCAQARADGYDTIQLTTGYGSAYDLIDCRGANRPDANITYEAACPPPFINLIAGAPLPRDAPGLVRVTDDVRLRCRCDRALDAVTCMAPAPFPGPNDDPTRRRAVVREASSQRAQYSGF